MPLVWIALGHASADHWQQQANAEAPVGWITKFQSPSVGFHHPRGDRQAEAAVATASAGGIKPLERHQRLIAQLRGNALTLVFDGDEQPIPLTLQTHDNRWFAIGEGIVDQIGDSAPKGYRLHPRLKLSSSDSTGCWS